MNNQPAMYTIMHADTKFHGPFKKDVFIENATAKLKHILTNIHTDDPSLSAVVRSADRDEINALAQYSKMPVWVFETLDEDTLIILSSRVDSICHDLAN